MTKLLTPDEVCERFRIKLSTLYQWTAHKKIPFIKMGGQNRFRESDLDRWIEENLKGLPSTKLL